MATIKQIAELAGVSRGTVDRVLTTAVPSMPILQPVYVKLQKN